ncbi:MAG: cobalt-precorrin-7 (C(5))-methyltransferase, partial [Lachnospiraceae bacterium]|nr:cobalt-precorrin-7 (C(5))-methyltransferase [Lachnospiraceae bacterium]MDY2760106.1 cobalt-precorrin-7 (C(5))-methyltransferase [Lachnospiraceae bacterium]
DEKKDRVAVLFSGDSGFYSGAEKCRESLPDGYEVEVIPGISSISAMSSVFHIPYDRAVIRSYHGRQIDNEEVSDTVRKYKNSYYLLSGREDVIKIGQIIKNTGIDARIHIGCDIGGDNESFVTADPDRVEENLPQGHLYTICVSGKEDA